MVGIVGDEIHNQVTIVETKRLPTRNAKPGLVKVELGSLDSKKALLRAKSKLKGTEHFCFVWTRGSMPHMEHLNHLNVKRLLTLIPDGQNY